MKNMEKLGIFFSVLIICVTLFSVIQTGSSNSQNIPVLPSDPTYPTSSIVPIKVTQTTTTTNTISSNTILTRTFTPTITPTQTPTIIKKTVLFSDDLSKWRSEWESVSDTTSGKTFYSGGSLHIRDTADYGKKCTKLNKNFYDFILDVDAKTIDGTIDNWQSLNVRSQSYENYYSLAISADGYYEIQKWENSKKVDLAGPVRSSYINTGIGATNHIHVEANKNTFRLSVNARPLSTVTDNTFKEGAVELCADSCPSNSNTEVVFNNLVITMI